MTTTPRIPVPSAGIELEGRTGKAPLSAVVAPPHPLYGGHLSNPVVSALCEGLSRRGVGALAFNWRGVGTSGGRPSGDPAIAAEDYAAALGFVKTSAPAPLAWIAAGYSFGAATALTIAAADPSVCEVVVVAPPVAMLPRLAPFAADARRVTVIAATDDDFAPLGDLYAAFAHVASARIVTVPGADHFFSRGGLDRVVAAVADS